MVVRSWLLALLAGVAGGVALAWLLTRF